MKPYFLALAAALPLAAAAPAQHRHAPGEPEHTHGEVVRAKSFAEAARRIADHVAAIDAALAANAAPEVADRANTIATLAADLGALSLAKDSGIPREKVREANLAGKDLALAAELLHEAADAADLAAARPHFDKVRSLASSIDALAPATFFCPMFCEGDKTYDKPGSCPVCHMKLKKQTTEQYTVEVVPVAGGAITAGVPVDLLWTIKDPRGMQVADVEIVHEMPLHLLMVSKDLSWYAHEHPELHPDGSFTMTWTFPAGGEYTLFHDFTPRDVGMQVVPVTLSVAGPQNTPVPLAPDADKPKTIDGYTVSLNTTGPITTGSNVTLSFTISRDGKPVSDLEPYLGALGHLVIISHDRKEFVHSHPHDDHDNPATTGGPTVDFEARFKAPGLYKGWAQFQHAGRVITVPFTFEVLKPSTAQ